MSLGLATRRGSYAAINLCKLLKNDPERQASERSVCSGHCRCLGQGSLGFARCALAWMDENAERPYFNLHKIVLNVVSIELESGQDDDSLLSSFIIDEMWPMCVVNSRAETRSPSNMPQSR